MISRDQAQQMTDCGSHSGLGSPDEWKEQTKKKLP